MPKLTKRAGANKGAIRDQNGDEDDIFNSSPMRGFSLCDGEGESNNDTAAAFVMDHNVGSAIKIGAKPSADAAGSSSYDPKHSEPNFRRKAGYKQYLQNLKRDVSRAEKEAARRKGSKLVGKGPRTLSEAVYDSDVDVNVRLTPGGTLRVKSHYEDEDDDFWGGEYDGDEEEI